MEALFNYASADGAGGEEQAEGAKDKDAKDKVLLQLALAALVEVTSPLEGNRLRPWRAEERPLAALYFWRLPSHEVVLEAMQELSVDVADYEADFVNHYTLDGRLVRFLAMRGPFAVVRSMVFELF